MIVDNIMNSTSMCDITYLIINDMGAAIGGSPEAYLLIYGFFFIFLPMLGLSIARNPMYGLLGATGGHIIVLLLGGAGCLPMPLEYLVIGNFIYVFLAGIMYYIYKEYKHGGPYQFMVIFLGKTYLNNQILK